MMAPDVAVRSLLGSSPRTPFCPFRDSKATQTLITGLLQMQRAQGFHLGLQGSDLHSIGALGQMVAAPCAVDAVRHWDETTPWTRPCGCRQRGAGRDGRAGHHSGNTGNGHHQRGAHNAGACREGLPEWI